MPSPPPITRQLLDAYVIEGMALVGDGVPAAAVEAAAPRIGVSTGPLAAADQVSIDYFDEILHSAAGGHDHAHDHDHDHKHGHDHEHHHAHGHDDSHGHAHGDDHAHGHDHDATQAQAAAPAQGHSQERGHKHDDGHSHDHKHDHKHEHKHEHKHDHAHEHTPATAAPVDAQAIAAARRAERKARQAALEAVMPGPAVYVLEKMAHGYKRGGGDVAGFYDAGGPGKAPLWSGLSVFERGGQTLDDAEVDDRLRFAIALTLLRAMSAAATPVLEDAGGDEPLAEAGGLVSLRTVKAWINDKGPAAFEARARDLASRYGPRFDPPAALASLAASGRALG